MFLDYIDFRINLAIGLIGMLVLLSYFIEMDIIDESHNEECSDGIYN